MASPNACASQLHERVIHNNMPLHGPWAGWRMAGRALVSPDGDRISPERLRGILFREAGLAGIAACRNRCKATATIVTLPPRERFDGSA
jgi:hypothetical protein